MGYATHIRRAKPSDADAIGRVHAQSWREAYTGTMSEQFMAGISDDERITRWRTILTQPGLGKQWVAEVDGAVVGFSASGPSRDEHPVRPLELWAIYLLTSHSRRGIGTALVEAAIGTGPACLWVLAANTPAQEFYRALGFEADGAEKHLEYWENQLEIRMVR